MTTAFRAANPWPAVVLIAAVWLTIDFLSLPTSAGIKQQISAIVDAVLPRARSGHGSPSIDSWIVQRDGELRLVFEFDEDMRGYVGEISALVRQRTIGW